MFEEIYFPRAAAKHRDAPLAYQRAQYLVQLKEGGASRSTLRKYANAHFNLVRACSTLMIVAGLTAETSMPPQHSGHSRKAVDANAQPPRRPGDALFVTVSNWSGISAG